MGFWQELFGKADVPERESAPSMKVPSVSQAPTNPGKTQPKCVALSGHVGCVRAVGASADGSIIATGSYDATVCLWDPATGQKIRRFNVESDIGTLAMSPNGARVIIGCNSNFVEVWDVQTADRLVRMKGHKRFPCSSMDCSKDERWAASASWEELGAFLWDLEAGKLRQQIVPQDAFHPRAVSVAFSPNSAKLAIGDADGVFIHEVPSGKLIARLKGHPGARCNFVTFLDDDIVTSVGAQGDVQIQSISHEARLWQQRLETCGTVLAGAVSDDGRHVAIGESGTVSEWDLETGSAVTERTDAHGDKEIMAVMYVPGTHTWLSCDVSGTVILWNPPGPVPVAAAPAAKTGADRIRELGEALKQRPSWAWGYDQLAREYWDQGDVVNMFRHFYAAAQVDPGSNQPHKYLKDVFDGIARYEDYRREDEADKRTDPYGPGGTVLVPELRAQIRERARERRGELESVIRQFES